MATPRVYAPTYSVRFRVDVIAILRVRQQSVDRYTEGQWPDRLHLYHFRQVGRKVKDIAQVLDPDPGEPGVGVKRGDDDVAP